MQTFKKLLLSFIIFLAVCAVGLYWFVNREVKKELDRVIASSPEMQFSYGDVSVDLLDRCVVLDNIDVTLPEGEHFTAEQVRILKFDQTSPVPHNAVVETKGLIVPVDPANFGPAAPAMQEIGIQSLAGDAVVDYEYDSESKTLDLKRFSLDDPKLGTLRLTGTLDQLDLYALRLEQLIGVRIESARLVFTDRELMGMLTADWAQKAGLSEQTTLDRIGAELDGLARFAAAQENDSAENVMRGLKRFLGDPGTMTVTVTPSEPVPVLYFFMGRDLFENLRLLGMEITTDSSDGI